MRWRADEHGWVAEPEAVVHALAGAGFEEFKREVTSHPASRHAAGGMWQGLDGRTGGLASVVWVQRHPEDEAVVFVEVDGEPLEGEEGGMDAWWSGIDEEVMACLEDVGSTEPVEIARRLGMSEEAVVSIVAMLAREGRVQICRIAATQPRSTAGRVRPLAA